MHPPSINTGNYSVIGAARSGIAAALFLKAKGVGVFLSEAGPEEKFTAAAKLLGAAGIDCEFGGHGSRVQEADVLVVSPGVPSDAPVVLTALHRGVEVISEIELGARSFTGRVVGITGTNGKTTTTALAGEIFRQAGRRTIVAGNIGAAFCDALLAQPDAEVAVLEVSSFQLDHCSSFHPQVAMITTLTPDHLYRYNGSFEEYTASKQRVFMNQNSDDALIYNADGRDLAAAVLPARSRLLPVSTAGALSAGGWVEDGVLLIDCGEGREAIADAASLQIRGRHNHANILMAALAARSLGVPAADVAVAVAAFRGVEHRLEQIRKLDGVEWINDSKATNVDSVVIALESMTRPVVLIAGGRDKGSPYDPLFELIRAKVKNIILLGEAADRMEAAFTGLAGLHRVASMEDAVALGRDLAAPGDTVLLSPACASFDMFDSFEHRGEVFSAAVRALKGGRHEA
jgi:UDP-N-acetylmuramoylalanine--D-glutamate ligase